MGGRAVRRGSLRRVCPEARKADDCIYDGFRDTWSRWRFGLRLGCPRITPPERFGRPLTEQSCGRVRPAQPTTASERLEKGSSPSQASVACGSPEQEAMDGFWFARPTGFLT